jgi:virginiamycin A acetyltransferase
MPIPDPTQVHPLPHYQGVIFLRNVVKSPLIEVGEYTYYDDPTGALDFEQRNVLYHFDFIGDRLVIGRYGAIARDVRFIMNGAAHSMAGVSTFPFYIFGGDWAAHPPPESNPPHRGDTVVGHDVWIGYAATIMPGVRIGNGAIIGACSVVTRDVPPYAIVAGNPARIVRTRFDEATIARLQGVAWWNWPIEKVTRHLDAIVQGDVEALCAGV